MRSIIERWRRRRHVPAERWVAQVRGRLSPLVVERDERHVAGCARCRAQRARVLRAWDAMTELRAEAPPELAWDSIRARLRWELSPAGASARLPVASDRRAATRRWLLAACAVGGVACAIAAGWWGVEATRPPLARRPAVEQPAQAAPAPQAAALALVVTRARGVVQIDGERDGAALFSRAWGPGAVVASAEGSVDLQFGDGSGVALGPRSTLRLERFDTSAIELSLDGVADLQVAPRLPGQRFLVRAGAQTVEVRGTQFRVEHRAEHTRVACRHGLVQVRDGAAAVLVAAGRVTSVRTGAPLSPPVALTEAELVELALAAPYQVPWASPRELLAATARLEVAAPGTHHVRLDGIELGAGDAAVRATRGRHLVETAERGAAYRRAGWIEVASTARALRFEVATAPAGAELGTERRRGELRARLDSRALGRCVRSITKQGVADTFVTVELSISHDGTIGYLNIVDTDLPAEVAECVRAVVAGTRFASGPAARLRERVDL